MRNLELDDVMDQAVAVVGLAGRFPGAATVEELWQVLREGREGVTFFTEDELLASGVPAEMVADPDYVPAAGILDDVEGFDAALFGYSPGEAEVIDPQQRLFLECAWAALEDAGYDPARTAGLVGVFGGSSMNSYLLHNLIGSPGALERLGAFQVAMSNDKDFLTTRVSYKLNLTGPSVTVQTACSSSLVASHLACQSLLAGECDLALAGGVSVTVPQISGYRYQRGGVASPDGRCRPFDAQAGGAVSGQGVGVVVLKRLADALEERDMVHAVVRGSAINNDGSTKVGFTAPSVDGQAEVIAEALGMAAVAPDSLGYLEAHGTGTELGDPIEVRALTDVFRTGTDRQGFCALGSVKSNIGHLDAAAGVAGLIKAVLVVEHGEIPGTVHFETPNPELDLPASPFFVNRELEAWDAPVRRAGVSSFGIGGTNAHLVLEQAPAPMPVAPARPWHLLRLSARSAESLELVCGNLADHLDAHPELELADVAHTLHVGRRAFDHRAFLVCRDRADALAVLRSDGRRRLPRRHHDPDREPARPIFLLPGLGDHYVHMAWGLYRDEPGFRRSLDRAAEILRPELGRDLREILFPEPRPDEGQERAPGEGGDLRRLLDRGGDETPTADDAPLDRTRFAHPALAAVEIALVQLLDDWGIGPRAMVGYSLGEIVAAHLAGVFSLEDALVLVARRARRIEELPEGAMLSVALAEGELASHLESLAEEELWIAAANGPALSVAAGAPAAVDRLAESLGAAGIAHRRLGVRHAFHTPLMEPAAEEIARLVAGFELAEPSLPVLSNVTGTWAEPGQLTDPDYWRRHTVEPVRFADSLGALWESGGGPWVEVGPGQALASLALQHPAASGDEPRGTVVVSLLSHRHGREGDRAVLLHALGQLWLHGTEVDRETFWADEERRRVPLPGTPFERRRYWIDARPSAASGAADTLAEKVAVEDRFHVPSWRRAPARPGAARGPGEERSFDRERVVLWTRDDAGAKARAVTTALADRLMAAGASVEWVDDAGGDPQTLGAAVEARRPVRIIHLASFGERADEERETARAFDAFLGLARSLARWTRSGEPVSLHVITSGAWAVESGDRTVPERALLQGPAVVLPQEHDGLAVSWIDVEPPEQGAEELADRLLAELVAAAPGDRIALRGRRRWRPDFERLTLGRPLAPGSSMPWPQADATVLVTGGLGALGLGLAERMARAGTARLVLLSRSGLPPRETWGTLASDHATDPDLVRRLRGVEAVEAAGAAVRVVVADVADRGAMERAVATVVEELGPIHAVLHAAGVPGGGLAQLKDRAAAAAVLAPKVAGSRVLAAVLADQPLELLVAFSSLAALAGGLGQVDYVAANAFLGAWASSGEAPWPVMAIDWPEWREDRWTAASGTLSPEAREALAEHRRRFGLDLDEGWQALVAAAASGDSRVLVATRPLEAELAGQHTVTDALEDLRHLEGDERHPRPELAIPYRAPSGPVEERLAGFWVELLGVAPVGADDDFFQLGGHSLLGTQLLGRVHGAFGVELPLRSLFEVPTVADMAVAVETALVERLDELPEDQAATLLATLAGVGEDP